MQISTDEVYGRVPVGSSTETDELRPRNPYSASKAGADRLAYSYWATYKVPVIITRASNNYGPNQFPEKIIPLFITNLIDDIPVPLYGDGQNERDWLHVDDHCRGVDLLIDKGEPGEVYNIGGGNQVKNVDLTHRLLELVGKPTSLIKPVADRPGHDRRYSLDTAKLEALGWKPQAGLRAGARARRSRGTARTRRGGVRSRTRTRPSASTTRRSTASADPAGPLRHVHGVPLVTGATGFAGGHLLDRLVRDGRRGARAGAQRRSARAAASRRRRGATVDLLDRAAVRARRSTPSARRSSITAPASPTCRTPGRRRRRALRVNVLGTHHLLEACRERRSRLPHRSSPGRRSSTGRRPTAIDRGRRRSRRPIPYGVSKLAQEMTAAASGLPVVLARPFNHAGPRQSAGVRDLGLRAADRARSRPGGAEPVLHVGNLDARRDITDVRDTVRAYQVLAETGDACGVPTTSAAARAYTHARPARHRCCRSRACRCASRSIRRGCARATTRSSSAATRG